MRWGSRDPTAAAVVAAALLVGPQVAARATRDALFLSSYDVTSLPRMAGLAAIVSLTATLAFSRALTRRSPARLVPAALGLSAALFASEWLLLRAAPRAAAVMVYLHHAILGAVLLSGFWSLVNERFDPHAARRAMGPIGAGASLGGVVGGLLAWRAAAAGIPAVLIALACANLVGLAALLHLTGTASSPPRASGEADRARATGAHGSGMRLVREVAYLRRLALLVVLGSFAEAVLDYLLGAAAKASVPTGPELMSFFALFHAGTGLLGLAVQTIAVRASLQGLGVSGTLAVTPLFTVLGAGLAIVWPRLTSVVLLRGGQAALRNSAFRAGYELLYTPLPEEQKRPSKVIVDVAGDRLGTLAGSGAVVLVLALAPASARVALLALAAAAAAAALALARSFRRGYVGALAARLRSGTVALEPGPVVDPTALLTLASVQMAPVSREETGVPPSSADPLMSAIADLRSGDAQRARRALAPRDLDPRLIPHVIPLLADDALFDLAAAGLRRAGPRCTGQLVDALLDGHLPATVRRRVARVLKGVPTQRAADGLVLGLADARFDLRYRCAQALDHLVGRNPAIAPARERVLEIAVEAAARAASSPRHLEHVFTLLALVLEREPLESARQALASDDAWLRGTALEYLENVLPPPVKRALWPHLGPAPSPVASGRSLAEVRDDLLRSIPPATAATPPSQTRRQGTSRRLAHSMPLAESSQAAPERAAPPATTPKPAARTPRG